MKTPHLPSIPPWAKSVKTWLAFLTVVFGFYAGAAAIGLEVPRPVWINEHLQLAGKVKKNTVRSYQSNVSHIRRQLIDARIAKSKAKPGSDLYNEFLRDEAELKDKLAEAKARLKKARGY